MNGLQTAVCVLLIIGLILNLCNAYLQISNYWKQYKHAKALEDAIKNLDNVMDETTKGMARDKFFQDIEELQKEKYKNQEDKGDKE